MTTDTDQAASMAATDSQAFKEVTDPLTPAVAADSQTSTAATDTQAPTAAADSQTSPVVTDPQAATVDRRVSFSEFNLQQPLRDAVARLGFEYCTPIQAQSLVYTLEGHDITGRAQTGTGKTAAFLITLINDLLSNPVQERRYLAEPRALIIAPTRELAMQIADDAKELTHFCGLHTVTLVGGEDYAKQEKALNRKPVDMVVATPGRLLDFVRSDKLYLGLIELMVLDEADRMLDMGFIPQVRQIVSRTPKKECRQTLLFSATFPPEVVELAGRWAMDPILVEVEPEKVAAEAVEQVVYLVTTADKYSLLFNLIAEPDAGKVLVFSNRRDQVRRLADHLYRNGVNCDMLSGEIPQHKRVRTLEAFKSGRLQVLVATDVAGRGLHIEDVTHVVNYTLPEEPEDYVHRIGRTGRAGSVGTSISFACEEDSFLLPAIEDKLGMKLECIHPPEEMLKPTPRFERESRFGEKSRGNGPRQRR